MLEKLIKKRIALLSLSIGPTLPRTDSYNVTLWILGVVFDVAYHRFSGGRRSLCFMVAAFCWTRGHWVKRISWGK